MTAPDAPKDELQGDLSSVAFDWLDLLVLLGIGYGAVLGCSLLEWQPRFSVLGTALAPVAFGGLALRRRYFPAKRGRERVARKLTLLGLLATGLLTAGVVLVGASAYVLASSRDDAPEQLSEREVHETARDRARIESLQMTDERPLSSEEAERLEASGEVGTFEDLVAALDAPPAPDVLARFEAEVRDEHEAALLADFEDRRRRSREGALHLGALGFAALALGGFLDGKRARKPAEV